MPGSIQTLVDQLGPIRGVNVVNLDHGPGPEKSKKKGGARRRETHSVRSDATEACATKSAAIREMHPRPITV